MISDERARMISETVNGIKMIKFNAWEDIIEKRIATERDKEVDILFYINMYNSVLKSFHFIAPKAITPILFTLIWYLEIEVSIPQLFSIISIINSTPRSLSTLSLYFTARSQSQVACRRLTDISRIREKQEHKDDQTLNIGQIELSEATFIWGDPFNDSIFIDDTAKNLQPKEALSEINLKINTGEFIGVIGEVGAGKSSLLLALMGELHIDKGTIKKNGRIAFVPQEAFLINDTLKNNIIFGDQVDEARYKQVIKLSELEADIRILSGGDQTEIGERGINLSGGQKQRISIARAAYSDFDIFFIDDALSALDGDVGESIMQNVFKEYLKGKTRILTTHNLSLLDSFDRVIFIKSGKIHKVGTIEELRDLEDFRDFINHSKLDKAKTKLRGLDTNPPVLEKYKSKVTSETNLITKESTQEGAVKMKTYLYYFSQGGLIITIISIALFFLTNIGRLWIDWYLGDNLNHIFGKGSKAGPKYIFFMIILLFFGIIGVRAIFFSIHTSEASRNMYRAMIERVIRRTMAYFDTTSSGVILNRCNNDTLCVDNRLSNALLIFLNWGALYIVIIITASYFAVPVGIIGLVVSWILIRQTVLFLKAAVSIARIRRLSSSPVIQAFNT